MSKTMCPPVFQAHGGQLSCWSCRYMLHKDMARKDVMTRLSRRACFELRSKTDCGSLINPLSGDPFSRPQRLVLILITMLFALLFVS